ncbi:DEAD/DEAH box helicase, partial [Gammaproteobacteria bacterium]|nr:DEAD/DEAH box helicase [Gammaproteobacteria bacterium]
MSGDGPAAPSFRDLNLPAPLLAALDEVGYETPTPIQSRAIPHLMVGLDLLGHAPTGTGKTAAFAIPLIARLDLKAKHVQVMTLTPTRELAIQVAEAFQRYASHVPGFHVMPIYGGQAYSGQIRQLKRGVHVVVGTPGRVMDHMRKGNLKLDSLQALVLDEADEMLRMGFIDEVEWILAQTPENRQMALFSATMPKEIARIARHHLRDPQDISIAARTATAELVRQRYWLVGGVHKLDALTRILETETFDAVLVFVRTKIATTDLAGRLEARGYAASALNGDMQQKQREQMIDRLKKGALDLLVATDVAARGLDVDRISHVINYDIPYDTEAYIHRIGRTGRAGRVGDAILFVAPRERRMLRAIENATRQKIDALELPSTEVVNNKRIASFKQQISDCLAEGDLAFMQGLVEQYQQEHDVPALDIAAALAKLSLGAKPLLLKPDTRSKGEKRSPARTVDGESARAGRREVRRRKASRASAMDIEQFRIEVGSAHGVQPSNIVGAIANEAGMDAQHIGRIDIQPEFSVVELPVGMPNEIFQDLRKAWICGRTL